MMGEGDGAPLRQRQALKDSLEWNQTAQFVVGRSGVSGQSRRAELNGEEEGID